VQCFDTFSGFLHKIYAAIMDGKGWEGTYNFFSRRLGATGGEAGHRAQGGNCPPCHPAGAAHAPGLYRTSQPWPIVVGNDWTAVLVLVWYSRVVYFAALIVSVILIGARIKSPVRGERLGAWTLYSLDLPSPKPSFTWPLMKLPQKC